jgi:hypothetical protein
MAATVPIGGLIAICGHYISEMKRPFTKTNLPILITNGMKDTIVEFKSCEKSF